MFTIQIYRNTIELDSKLGFPTGQDSATFWDKETEVSSLSRDKGTMGQAKNLTKGRDGTQDKTGRAEKDILKQKTMF